jgi:hypothetical protein
VNNEYLRDLLAAFSLANLSLIGWWDALLNYTPTQAYFLEHAPPRTEYAAAFANVILIGLVLFALIRFTRWIATRFGTAGFIVGSLPILLLISLPAAKSIVRLVENRLPDWDLRLVLGIPAILLLATAIIARKRFLAFASSALITISPLILLEAGLSISRCWTDRSALYADGPLAAQAQNSLPRVVWIIFDELDYRLSFEDRPSNVPMNAFDRLRAESLFAESAVSPASDTVPSVPSLLIGKIVADLSPPSLGTKVLDSASPSGVQTIFKSVHSMGGNAAVVGWYIPYCRLVSRDVTTCSAHDMENELNETGPTFQQSLSLQLQSLFAYGYRSLLGQSPRAVHRIEMLNQIHQDSVRAVADPSLNLVFLHLPVPHAPYLYDRFSYTFPKRVGFGSYFDNLALADVYLGNFREAMTDAGLWDKTTVIVSSDHPDRKSSTVDGKDDPRVPFLLKMAGTTKGTTYEAPLPTILTKPLIEAILSGAVVTSDDATEWLTAHSK